MKIRISEVLILVFFSFIHTTLFSQGKKEKIYGEAIGSVFFPSGRFFYHNGDEGIYGEIRCGYVINQHLEVNAFAGHEKRYYMYFARFDNGNEVPLFMDRHYIPIGINLRLNLTEFFYERLKLWKKEDKWDVYNQVGIVTLRGKDFHDDRDAYFKAQGAHVPYYFYPYVQEYGKVYLSYLAGVRLNFNRHLGVFIEGGQGALTDLQIGISTRF